MVQNFRIKIAEVYTNKKFSFKLCTNDRFLNQIKSLFPFFWLNNK